MQTAQDYSYYADNAMLNTVSGWIYFFIGEDGDTVTIQFDV